MANYNDGNTKCYAWQEMTSEDKKYAAVHLNETDETREDAIKEIKRWFEESDDLCARIDDFLILRFLRVCKFNVEKTKTRIRNYCTQRLDIPEWYLNKDPFQSELQELLDLGLYLPLLKPDEQGRLIIILRGTRHDPRIHNISDVAKVIIMGTEIAMKYYPKASIYGQSIFIDMDNTTVRHIAQFRPYMLMNMVHAWQHCYPMRFQSIVIFNAPKFLDVTMNIIKSFMTEKIKNRFHIYSHDTMKNCFENISANILPIEYGGTNSTTQELTDYWKTMIEENRDWLNEDNDKMIVSTL